MKVVLGSLEDGGKTVAARRDEALRAVQTLALRVIADRLEQGEPVSEAMLSAFRVAA